MSVVTTAIVMPIYNESPERVFAAVEAMYEEVEATGLGRSFDWFFLSDTTNADVFVAEEAAFPGDLDDLRAQLVALRIAEAPEGIGEAEDAARDLQHVVGAPPHVASPERLDAIGQAARRLELALDPAAPSPFSAAMRSAAAVADALWADVQAAYRSELV